jgi:hypothetical protein
MFEKSAVDNTWTYSERDKVIGDWRKVQKDELHNLYSSTDIVKMTKT